MDGLSVVIVFASVRETRPHREPDARTPRTFVAMSVFDALGAAAAIAQFIGYGIKLSNKAIAIYNGRHQSSDLLSSTQSFAEQNQKFMDGLRLTSSGPASGEDQLIQIAKQCQHTADELIQIIKQTMAEAGQKSKRGALRSAIKTSSKEKDVLAKREELERLRVHCHEQLTVMMR